MNKLRFYFLSFLKFSIFPNRYSDHPNHAEFTKESFQVGCTSKNPVPYAITRWNSALPQITRSTSRCPWHGYPRRASLEPRTTFICRSYMRKFAPLPYKTWLKNVSRLSEPPKRRALTWNVNPVVFSGIFLGCKCLVGEGWLIRDCKRLQWFFQYWIWFLWNCVIFELRL